MPRSTINGTAIDLDGKEMILDADQDTSITVDTDDQIDIKIAGSDKLVISSTSHLSTTTAGTSNLVLGVNAGNSIASGGNYNVCIGDEAGTALTTGDNNVAIGFQALDNEDEHGGNVAIGRSALSVLNAGADGFNTAVGHLAGDLMTTGTTNTLIGARAGDALTVGSENVAIGDLALSADTQGSRSVAIGRAALDAQNFTSATNSNNTAIGYDAGSAVTTGVENTFVGSLAGDAITDADYNTALGSGALGLDDLGSFTTAIGRAALAKQNYASATNSHNTAVGANAGEELTTGLGNTLIGSLAGDAITTGINSTIIGYLAGSGVSTGTNNTMVGQGAGAVATGSYNNFFGAGNGTASGNVMTTGSKNTIIGGYDGNKTMDGITFDIRSSDGSIVLSDGDGNPRGLYDGSLSSPLWRYFTNTNNQNNMQIAHTNTSSPYGLNIEFSRASPNNTANYFIQCTDSTQVRHKVFSNGNVQNVNNSYTSLSDEKLKEQIKDASSQWDDIKALKVRKYKLKQDVSEGDSDALWQIGVIAQEAETAGMNGLVYDVPDMDEDKKDLGTVTKSFKYSILYMKAVKALQEAMTRIETLESKVKTLEGS